MSMSGFIKSLYQTQSDFITVTKIEECAEYNKKNIHQHDYYEIIWFTEVEFEDTIQIDFVDFPVSENNFYVVAAGHLHRMDRTGKKGWVFTLSKEFYHNITPLDMQARSIYAINSIVNQKKCEMCRTLIRWIVHEYNLERRYALIESYFKTLFIHLTPIFEKNSSHNHEKQSVARLLDDIEDHYIEQREVPFYAQRLRLSERSANELAKKVTGKTIKQLIQERLILEIKREIAADKITFKEMAFKLQFNEASYFSRFFKKQTGMSPEEYRTHFINMSRA